MLKYLVALLILIAVLIGGFFAFNAYIYDEKQGGVEDFKNATYIINDEPVTLLDGKAVRDDGDGWETVTTYFGNEVRGDLNDDGIEDVAFILTQNGGGTGTFVYVVAAIKNAAGRYNGSNAILLGDRIAPQTSEIRNGILVVNYADRGLEDPFSTPPYIGVSVYLYYDGTELKAEWPVSMYYYDPKLDTDEKGNILCSEKGLVPVPRMMPGATIETKINTLIGGKLADAEKERGITTEFPLEGFTLVKADQSGGTLTLTFDDPKGKTTGGACRVEVLRKQIEETARHLEGVQEVVIKPETLFQP